MTDILFMVLFYLIAVLTGISIGGLLRNFKLGRIMKRTGLEIERFGELKDKLSEQDRHEMIGRIEGRLAVTRELLK